MPRKTRMYLPDVPAHIVQRGNNRDACFFCEDDFRYYKQVLAEGMERYGARLHAYCLMTNHVHLLITPDAEDSISRVMQHVGRQYVQYINRSYRRSGTLWEGRHKGSLVEAETYLLSCQRYIELNPVSASMVEKPEEYPWSSYHSNALGAADPLISVHEVYMRIADNDGGRRRRYRELFRYALPDADVHQIRTCLAANQLLGDGQFKRQVEAAIGRRCGYEKRGRPLATAG